MGWGSIEVTNFLSLDDVRLCFDQEHWKGGRFLIGGFEPSETEWLALETFSFGCFHVHSATVPWRFLQNTQSTSVYLNVTGWELERPLGSASPIGTKIILSDPYLRSEREIDTFCRDWLALSSNVELQNCSFSVESWQHFWQASDLLEATTWRSLKVASCRIDREELCIQHLSEAFENVTPKVSNELLSAPYYLYMHQSIITQFTQSSLLLSFLVVACKLLPADAIASAQVECVVQW